jgi:ABC-type polysaccharide/polyol phosphate transport system ATPase subunit
MREAITVNDLTKTFLLPHERRDTLKESVIKIFKKRTYEKFHALENVDLEVKKGEFLGIVGKNGSGKSTLLKILAGIYHPSKGSINVEGSVAPFLELGIGFQDELTARENIFMNATLLGMDRKQINKKFADIVAFAEIGNFLDLKIKNFSSGMRARLAFSIAKESDADIYLCDEVLAVGDEQFQKKCMQVFEDWKRAGKTILLVSHASQIINDFCTRAVLLEDGHVITSGNPERVLEEYHIRSQSN